MKRLQWLKDTSLSNNVGIDKAFAHFNNLQNMLSFRCNQRLGLGELSEEQLDENWGKVFGG